MKFEFVLVFTLSIIGLSMLIVLYRIIKGPSIADRVVGLDLLMASTLAFLAVFAMLSKSAVFLDAGIVLSLIAFIGTIAFAYYLQVRRKNE
ncbi:MAG: cation:proton antiporter [Ignavibacteriaceae bacterium]|nr:cation:proton antiporter [Ignavibacteriaceae bacterium]